MNFLISPAAGSVTLKATVGAGGAVVAVGVVVAGFADILVNSCFQFSKLLITKSCFPEAILLRFSQNDKLRFQRLDRDLPGYLFGRFSEGLRLRRLRLADNDGHAFVAAFANF